MIAAAISILCLVAAASNPEDTFAAQSYLRALELSEENDKLVAMEKEHFHQKPNPNPVTKAHFDQLVKVHGLTLGAMREVGCATEEKVWLEWPADGSVCRGLAVQEQRLRAFIAIEKKKIHLGQKAAEEKKGAGTGQTEEAAKEKKDAETGQSANPAKEKAIFEMGEMGEMDQQDYGWVVVEEPPLFMFGL